MDRSSRLEGEQTLTKYGLKPTRDSASGKCGCSIREAPDMPYFGKKRFRLIDWSSFTLIGMEA